MIKFPGYCNNFEVTVICSIYKRVVHIVMLQWSNLELTNAWIKISVELLLRYLLILPSLCFLKKTEQIYIFLICDLQGKKTVKNYPNISGS